MAMFNSYVGLPEGIHPCEKLLEATLFFESPPVPTQMNEFL